MNLNSSLEVLSRARARRTTDTATFMGFANPGLCVSDGPTCGGGRMVLSTTSVVAGSRFSRRVAARIEAALVGSGVSLADVGDVMAYVGSRTAFEVRSGALGVPFMMFSQHNFGLAWAAIKAEVPSSQRPVQVRELFLYCCLNMREDTGEVMLSRAELAELVGCSRKRVGEALTVLRRLGLLRTELVAFDGVGGRLPRDFVSPYVAWRGNLVRNALVARGVSFPALKLVKGGKRERSRSPQSPSGA